MAEKKPVNLAEALIHFQNTVSTIDGNAKSRYGKFADLPNILSVIRPALRDAGLSVSQVADSVNGEPGLKTVLSHTSGEQIEGITPLCINKEPMITKEGKVIPPNPMMEWGKAMTYTRRYALQSVLGICMGLEDNEPEENDPVDPAPTATQAQQTKPAAKAKPDENILGAKLTEDERAQWIDFIKAAPADWRSKLVKTFATQFETGNRKVSDEITHVLHTVFLKEYTDKNPIPEAAAK